MFLVIAIALALLYAGLKPLSDGLFDTSMWVAKIVAPPEAEDNDTTRQCLKMAQAALMEGWLSNVPFITTIIFVASVIAGLIYQWWAGILIFFLAATCGGVTRVLFGRPVSYYLPFLYHKMVNRAAYYKVKSDHERLEASESFCRDLREIMALYEDSRLRPPTPKQVRNVPYGNLYYWLEHGGSL